MNTSRVLAVVIIGIVIVGLATFSFVGRSPSSSAPAEQSQSVPVTPAATSSTSSPTLLPTMTSNSTSAASTSGPSKIQQGPVSNEPKIKPIVPPQSVDSSQPQSGSTQSGSATSSSGTTTSAPTSTSGPTSASFTVNANDDFADLTHITVSKGTLVELTFNVEANTTYHGGLEFRSSSLNTDTIPPGGSKTITFTAQNSITFTPYWPSTNIAKPYQIVVTVQ